MADLLILAVETATGCGSVALTRGWGSEGHLLAEYTVQPEVSHARRLLGSVTAMLVAAGLKWGDLDGVAVSQGPGSFTGLRIGMAAAQGLAMAGGLPLVAVPTLDALAAQVVGPSLPLCCLLDARKQQIYGAFYAPEIGGWRRSGPYFVLTPDQLAPRLTEPTLVVGPGVAACLTLLATHPMVYMAAASTLQPRAATVGFYGARMLASHPEVTQTMPVVPLYVRASEAELNLRTAAAMP